MWRSTLTRLAALMVGAMTTTRSSTSFTTLCEGKQSHQLPLVREDTEFIAGRHEAACGGHNNAGG